MFHFTEIAPGVKHIQDAMGVCFTLIEGDKRAILFDTGYGMEDVQAYVRTLTDKPVKVYHPCLPLHTPCAEGHSPREKRGHPPVQHRDGLREAPGDRRNQRELPQGHRGLERHRTQLVCLELCDQLRQLSAPTAELARTGA